MFNIPHFGLFAFAVLMVNITPGATFLAVSSAAVTKGVKSGILTAAGAFCGLLVYAIASWAGLLKIITESVVLFNLVRYAGVAFLFYFAGKAFMQKAPEIPGIGEIKAVHDFRKGLTVNLLNPFSAILFLTLIPQFVQTNTKDLSSKILFLGLWISFSALTVNLGYALLFGLLRKYLMRYRLFWKWQGIITGLLFLYLGIRIAFFK